MDWGRAKTVLIISFLMLNVLLGFQLWNSRSDKVHSLTDTAIAMEETNKLLASKNITVQMKEIPKETPKLKAVNYKETYSDKTTVSLPEPVSTVNFFGRSRMKSVLDKAGVNHAEQYELDPAASKEGLQVMNQMYDKLPLFDITLQLMEQKGKLTGYKQTYVEVQSGGDAKEQKVISAYTALKSLADIHLKDNSVITDVRLGYHGQRFDADTQYMLPVWRVVLNSGELFYVEAFSGAVEGTQDGKETADARMAW